MHKKVTDNEIKTALKGAILNAKEYDCKIWSIEVYKLENALDLINRLQSEKETLEARIGVYETCNARKDEAIRGLEAENERLRDSKNSDDNSG